MLLFTLSLKKRKRKKHLKNRNTASAALAALAAASSLVPPSRAAAAAAAARATAGMRAASKLTYVAASLFTGVLTEGFCTTRKGADDGDGDGEEAGAKTFKPEEDVAGTGLGAGTGRKDISDELHDEDQLLGAKQEGAEEEEEEEAKAKQQGGKEKEEEDKGIEMSDDFAGEVHDLPDDDDDDSDAGDDDDKKDRLDQQMADEGDLGPEADDVDARLWDGDDQEEDAAGDDDGKNKGIEDATETAPALEKTDASRREFAPGGGDDEKEGGGEEEEQ